MNKYHFSASGRIMDRLIVGLLILGVLTLVAERVWTVFLLPDPPTELPPVSTTVEASEQGLLRRAAEMRRKNRPDLALSLLQQAREVAPESLEILYELGQCQEILGDFSTARDSYALIRSLDADSPLGYSPVAHNYLAQGKLDLALDWMRQAHAVDPTKMEPVAWMLFINDSLEDFLEADRWSDWLYSRITNQPQPMAMLARHHYLTGDFESAIQYANLALTLKLPDHLGSAAIFMRIKRDEALANGNPQPGIDAISRHYPGLRSHPPQLSAETIQPAVDLAQLLRLAGQEKESTGLLGAVMGFLDQPFASSGADRIWLVPARAEALALLGETDEALAELQEISDQGWRFNWRWETELNFNFMSVRGSESFQQLVIQLDADIETQRQRSWVQDDIRSSITDSALDSQ